MSIICMQMDIDLLARSTGRKQLFPREKGLNFNLNQYSLNLLFVWFNLALTSIIFSSVLLVYITKAEVKVPKQHNFNLYTALPSNQSEVETDVAFKDGRAKIVENFFKGYNSILANQSDNFIKAADKYNLDYRLLPAISMQESNGAKRVITDSYNPFGFGIYGSNVIRFQSWEEAIEKVAKALRSDYLNQGLTTPDQIMTKYTPPSAANGGSWAKGVSSFMAELR